MKRRVVITGLGIVSPVGNDITTAWDNIVNGRSGISRISRFDPSAITTHIAGEVKDFDISTYISSKEARQMDTFIHYGLAAGMQAWRDCGLKSRSQRRTHRRDRGFGHRRTAAHRGNPGRISGQGSAPYFPVLRAGFLINLISGHISITYGMKGPSYAVVSACTTGLHSIGDAARLIEYGDADVMLAGGAESTVSPLGIGGFAAMRALSTRNDDPTTASRPWDRDRDGFVLGEGAGVLVLEEYEHARSAARAFMANSLATA